MGKTLGKVGGEEEEEEEEETAFCCLAGGTREGSFRGSDFPEAKELRLVIKPASAAFFLIYKRFATSDHYRAIRVIDTIPPGIGQAKIPNFSPKFWSL